MDAHLHTSSVMIMDMDSTPFIFPSAGNTYSSISGRSDASHWVYISSFQAFFVKVNEREIIHYNFFSDLVSWVNAL